MYTVRAYNIMCVIDNYMYALCNQKLDSNQWSMQDFG